MTSEIDDPESFVTPPRYRDAALRKSSGATYTPVRLAEFAATKMLSIARFPKTGPIRLLDPACGDGSLLLALLAAMPPAHRARSQIFGFDTHLPALRSAEDAIRHRFPTPTLHFEHFDFLEYLAAQENDLFATQAVSECFDLVIANPPYVRTQVLGAQQVRKLAQRFGLTGRVDLYYPFVLGIGQILAPRGVAGLIVSNRFMTTRSGKTIRSGLLSSFNIHHVWDLGDTRLFDAAVLPAFILASGQELSTEAPTGFTAIYSADRRATVSVADPLMALEQEHGPLVSVPDGRSFEVRRGTLFIDKDQDAVWRLSGAATDGWLAKVAARTWATFSRIGKIRVGVKTTADRVFIRSDWAQLPLGQRPELLRPLTTRHCARRFKPIPDPASRQILYPHESGPYGRRAVDLTRYPKSAAYLAQHRTVLEARTYVIEAGRQWFEIWVAHDPSGWAAPKLVFPDISEKPMFWLDQEGTIVNGECYWLRCENGADPDWLWLALAVANSTFIEAFYDHRFNNKLYAGRRRFITQYVEQFPLPDPDLKLSRELIGLAKRIYFEMPSVASGLLTAKLDKKVWAAFGLAIKNAGFSTAAQ